MAGNHFMLKKIKSWISCNTVAVILVLIFISIYFISKSNKDALFSFGATGMDYLNREYYRWITCLFLHYNIGHLFVNSAALLSVSSLLGSFLKKRQFLFLFLSGGILAEIAYSIVISDQIYDIGASSGLFALIACLVVCILRFPEQFHVIWYRLDVIIVIVYFVFANTSITAFLVHTFGFAFGILIGFFLILTRRINIR